MTRISLAPSRTVPYGTPEWMNASPIASRQGLRLLQGGVALLLLTSLFGFAIPYVVLWGLGAG